MFSLSTEVREVAAPAGPEPLSLLGEVSSFGRMANREASFCVNELGVT